MVKENINDYLKAYKGPECHKERFKEKIENIISEPIILEPLSVVHEINLIDEKKKANIKQYRNSFN